MEVFFDNERPIYLQLKEKIKIMIISGKYQLGEKLPSVRDLALLVKVNPNTVLKALTELEEEKLIITERTNGKYVTNDKKLIEMIKRELSKDIIKKYLHDMNNLGIDYNDAIKYLREEGEKKWPY